MRIYAAVLINNEQGYWEINLDNGKALFRDYEHKREGDPQKEAMLHDWEEIYSTIEQFLREKMQMKFVKEIIPGVKYMFSKDSPFCEFFVEGTVSHNPNQRIHCSEFAEVIKNGQSYCFKHAHVNF